MERIRETTRSTGKKCECKDSGDIVERFVKKYGKSNGIMGPGHHTPSWVESTGFTCSICGRAYGPPMFRSLLEGNSQLQRDVAFELSLSKATLAKPIELEDLPIIQFYKRKKRKPVMVLNIPVAAHSLVPATKKTTTIPRELKKLIAGTTVYVVPSDRHEAYHNPHKEFSRIILSTTRDAKSFEVHNRCLQ